MTPEEIRQAGEQLQQNLTANQAVVVPAGISNSQIMDANKKLVGVTDQTAVRGGEEIELRQQMLAPGLSGGSNAPGGYMYQRNVAPVVGALTSGLTAGARQNVLRGAIRDNLFTSQKQYEDAQYAYRERERAYQKEQVKRSRERRQRAEAAAMQTYGGGGGGPSGYSNIELAPTGTNDLPYVGNPDFRGYLRAIGQERLLPFVGNDGKINRPKAQSVLGSYGPYKNVDSVQGHVSNMFSDFKRLSGK